MFEQCANGYKHVTSTVRKKLVVVDITKGMDLFQGSIAELSFSHQQLTNMLKNIRSIRERYKARLKWLLTGDVEFNVVPSSIKHHRLKSHIWMHC